MNRQQLADAYDKLEALRSRAADQPERTTSAAKEIDPDGLKGTSLENAPDAGSAFRESASGASSPSVDSEQVKASGSRLESTPPPEMASGADRDRHAEEMSKDDDTSRRAEYEAMLKQIEEHRQGREEGRGMSPGSDRGLG